MRVTPAVIPSVTSALVLGALLAGLAQGAGRALAQTASSADRPPEEIQMGISVDAIPVTSDFAGARIAVFGTIENPDRIGQMLNEYSIIVTIAGPREDTVIRRKERVAGIWVNRQSRVYRAVPTFYALAASRRLEAVAPGPVLREHRIGIDNLPLNLFSTGGQTYISPEPEFAGSLRRIRREGALFTEDPAGVVFLGSSLFRATLSIPSNAPIGGYTVSAYLFRNGALLASREGAFRVERAGFERLMYDLAHVYSWWYGIFAVLAALATGWLGSVIFRRN